MSMGGRCRRSNAEQIFAGDGTVPADRVPRWKRLRDCDHGASYRTDPDWVAQRHARGDRTPRAEPVSTFEEIKKARLGRE